MLEALILEDNSEAIEVIRAGFQELERELGEIVVTVISKGIEATNFVNNQKMEKFNVILLDYISADDKNFHQAVFGRVDVQKIIAISNTSVYNKMAEDQGVLRIVRKDYYDLADFKNKLKKEIENMLG